MHIELVGKLQSDQLRHYIPENTRKILDIVCAHYFNENKYFISTFQFVTSKPKSHDQIWHADNKYPGLTIIIPLIDVDLYNGPDRTDRRFRISIVQVQTVNDMLLKTLYYYSILF